jgi:hypothetical protein
VLFEDIANKLHASRGRRLVDYCATIRCEEDGLEGSRDATGHTASLPGEWGLFVKSSCRSLSTACVSYIVCVYCVHW